LELGRWKLTRNESGSLFGVTSTPKTPADSFSVITQVVLPNDANPLGFILGGTVMHLIDIAGAMCASRHSRTRVMTAAVDGLQFLHPIPIGDIIILEARATCAFTRSLEIQVDVFGESTLRGTRRRTSRAYLTFVAVDADGHPLDMPPLTLVTPEEVRRAADAGARRAARLAAKQALAAEG
jgi:acyl-CoA hydrolase